MRTFLSISLLSYFFEYFYEYFFEQFDFEHFFEYFFEYFFELIFEAQRLMKPTSNRDQRGTFGSRNGDPMGTFKAYI